MSSKHKIGAKFPAGKPGQCGTSRDGIWKTCKGKHPVPIEYPLKNKGNIKRKGSKDANGETVTYPGDWSRHNEYIVQGKFGLKERFKGQIPIKEPRMNKYGNIAEGHYKSTSRNNFPVQYHHVIPISVMDETTFLKKNIVLLGWDINDGWSNGICMPYNYEDIKRYHLQAHRGGHADYNTSIGDALEEIDNQSEHLCWKNNKVMVDELLELMDEFVNTWIQKLIDWDLTLHSKSEDYR